MSPARGMAMGRAPARKIARALAVEAEPASPGYPQAARHRVLARRLPDQSWVPQKMS